MMLSRPGFGSEALLRYHLWCGANPDDAVKAVSGKWTDWDRMPEGEMLEKPAPWLPRNEVADRNYGPGDLKDMLEGFFSKYDLGEEWWGSSKFAETRDFLIGAETPAERGRGGESIILGLTGERGAGKTEIGNYLVRGRGFIRTHPFNPGKALLRGYYVLRGASEDEALRMTDGDLKDVPSAILPVNPETGQHHSSRWLMERLGNYMGTEMGVEWTIGSELRHHLNGTQALRLLVESVVYEESVIRSYPNGKIGKIVVDEAFRKPINVAGEITDSYVDLIGADFTVVSRMEGLEKLFRDFDEASRDAGIDYGQDPEPEPDMMEP